MTTPKIDYVASWLDRLNGKVYSQFRDDPNLALIISEILAPQAQDIEDALQSLLSLPSIDDSEGVQLDLIGRIVTQPRNGYVDTNYRVLLKARIRANRSTGTSSDIYAVFSVLFSNPSMLLQPSVIATITLSIWTPITEAQAEIGAGFLADAKADGIRAIFVWQPDVDANMFTFAEGTFLIAASLVGDTSLSVASTAGMPASGSVILDPGLSVHETVTYTVVDGQTLAISAAAHAHAAHAWVEISNDPGLGFGDSSNPSTGGKFAGAIEA